MKQFYIVRLDDGPEGDERTRLEGAFREVLNRQYGGEYEAGCALFTHLDTAKDSLEGLTWARAFAIACEQVPVPPGASFRCELHWPSFTGG